MIEARELLEGTSISCIIPAWNEGPRIAAVLETVCSYPYFDEVIIVDDGSIDDTVKVSSDFAEKYSHVRVISHKVNKGKSAAVLTGVAKSSGSMIAMIDADLLGLSHKNIDAMLLPVLQRDCSMTILDREGDRQAIWGFTNCARFFGGERAFWREDFEKIDIPEDGGFLLEVIMNMYYIKSGKDILNVHCPNLFNIHKHGKFGPIKTAHEYLKVGSSILRKSGVRNFVAQMHHIKQDTSDKKWFEEFFKQLYIPERLQVRFDRQELLEYFTNNIDSLRQYATQGKEYVAQTKNKALLAAKRGTLAARKKMGLSKK